MQGSGKARIGKCKDQEKQEAGKARVRKSKSQESSKSIGYLFLVSAFPDSRFSCLSLFLIFTPLPVALVPAKPSALHHPDAARKCLTRLDSAPPSIVRRPPAGACPRCTGWEIFDANLQSRPRPQLRDRALAPPPDAEKSQAWLLRTSETDKPIQSVGKDRPPDFQRFRGHSDRELREVISWIPPDVRRRFAAALAATARRG